jgi:hypothetical protein
MRCKCCHHWLIENSEGPLTMGRCKLCGEEKEFANHLSGIALKETAEVGPKGRRNRTFVERGMRAQAYGGGGWGHALSEGGGTLSAWHSRNRIPIWRYLSRGEQG